MKRLLCYPALLLATACRDGTPTITPDRAALGAALAEAAVLTGRAGGYSSYAFTQVDETGDLTLASTPGAGTARYEAIGVMLIFDMRGSGAQLDQGWFNGVVAWTNLDLATMKVDEVSFAGAEGSGPEALLTGSAQVGSYANNRGGIAQYYHRGRGAFYVGTGGNYTITSARFDSNRDCAIPADQPAPPVTCRVAFGTMKGTFNYNATLATGTGDSTYTQPAVNFDLPAIRVTLTN